MRKYKIYYAEQPLWASYPVEAKDAIDARVMGEVWGKSWKLGEIQRIVDEGELNENPS